MRRESLLRFVIRRGVLTRPELPCCLLQLAPKDTGLPVSILASISRWLVTPRVEVFRTYSGHLTYDNLFSVTIPYRKKGTSQVIGDPGDISEPDLRLVMTFIRQNRELLIGHWFEKPGCSDFDLFDKLTKVSGKFVTGPRVTK